MPYYHSFTLFILVCLIYRGRQEISIQVVPVNPVSASLRVTIVNEDTPPECRIQVRSQSDPFADPQCEGGPCTTTCQSTTISNMSPGLTNQVAFSYRSSEGQWQTIYTAVLMPFERHIYAVSDIEFTSATIRDIDTQTKLYRSPSCTVRIRKLSSETYEQARCSTQFCSPCESIKLIDLDPETDYDVEIYPVYAAGPYNVNFTTNAFEFLLDLLSVSENSASLRILREAGSSLPAQCFLYIQAMEGSNQEIRQATCDNTDRCPTDCTSVINLTSLVANRQYKVLMNSTTSSSIVSAEFKTGRITYSARSDRISFTWSSYTVVPTSESSSDDKCHYFVRRMDGNFQQAECNGGSCPDDCESVNITGLTPATRYEIQLVPWRLGGLFRHEFYTLSVSISINSSRLFPTKAAVSFSSNYEPRGTCQYRLYDERLDSLRLRCQSSNSNRCPTDCNNINITDLSPNKIYYLDVISSNSRFADEFYFRTPFSRYELTTIRLHSIEVEFNIRALGTDFTRDVPDECQFSLTTIGGARVNIGNCIFPPCNYRCNNNTYVLGGLSPGEKYYFHLNSRYSNGEVSFFLFTVETSFDIAQLSGTLRSAEISLNPNMTDRSITCSLRLYNNLSREITPTCQGSSCPRNCSSFVLINLEPSSIYTLELRSSYSKNLTSFKVYTLHPPPKIKESRSHGKTTFFVSWEYPEAENIDFLFTVAATDPNTEEDVFVSKLSPPASAAILTNIPPERLLTLAVCTEVIEASHLKNCDKLNFTINITDPDPLPPVNVTGSSDNGRIRIELPAPTVFQGRINVCYIYVIYTLLHRNLSNFVLPVPAKLGRAGISFHFQKSGMAILHARMNVDQCNSIRRFEIGDNIKYDGVTNKAILRDNYVSFLYRTCISPKACGDSEIPASVYLGKSQAPIIAVIVIAVIIYFASFGCGAYFWLKTKVSFSLHLNKQLEITEVNAMSISDTKVLAHELDPQVSGP